MEYETIYLLYGKWNNELYAYSILKDKVKAFLRERNPKRFHLVKRKINGTVLSAFMSQNYLLQITDIPLFDGEKYITVMATMQEENMIEDASDQLYVEMEVIRDALLQYPFKKKYLKVINHLTQIVSKRERDGEKELIVEIDTFSLFCSLFKNTF